MIALWIILGVVALLLVVCVMWYISCYNRFMRLKNNIDESRSTIDVSLKKRFDLIPNLVETVKGYAKHEKETLEAVISARGGVASAKNAQEKVKAENELTGALRQLLVVAEAYPELKANANFIDLQNQLKSMETEIANSRRYFNATVKEYNNLVSVFPSNIIARQKGYTKEAMYEIENPAERQNVKVQF
ncbi:MAG: LemA family protein [Clostridia bacterium]|nr:LemA family protein [Clostridia bacterium]